MVQEIRYNTPIYLNSQNLNNQTSKNIYKNQLNSQNISIPLGFSIWLKKINIKFYSEIEKSLTFVFKNMKENKFKVYKWKLIHYILPCKELLFKWHITTNNLCNNKLSNYRKLWTLLQMQKIGSILEDNKKPVFKT